MAAERPGLSTGERRAGGDERAAGTAPSAIDEVRVIGLAGGDQALVAELVDLAVEVGAVDGGGAVVVRHRIVSCRGLLFGLVAWAERRRVLTRGRCGRRRPRHRCEGGFRSGRPR